MIIKERDPAEHSANDPFAIAGAKAEEQMSFYLRRAFYDHPDFHVLNDLRFEDDTGDAAQIDHLIIHKYGFIIIESKSVTSGIKVNKQHEWIRFWNNRPQGMPSPVQQAKRQIEFLQRALNSNAEELTGKMLGLLQKRFGGYEWDILVAISDSGTITREVDVPELCKADQIVERVRDRFKKLKRAANILSLDLNAPLAMDAGTREKVIQFFLQHHCPRSRAPSVLCAEPPSSPSPKAPKNEEPKHCPKCNSPLVKRIAKKGQHANAQFWGCSAFPKCRYSEGMEA